MRHQTHSSWPAQAVHWYLEWALPGLGMFSEAYIIFSAGQIRFLQEALYPSCFNSDAAKITDCNPDMIGHLADYVSSVCTAHAHSNGSTHPRFPHAFLLTVVPPCTAGQLYRPTYAV